MQSSEIGLKFEGELPPFPFGIGTIDDVFHSSGISPVTIDMLKRVVHLQQLM